MDLPVEIISQSEEDTFRIAKEFAGNILPGEIICLTGNLGTGKTQFVKGFCSRFGIDRADSPTFAIVNEYSGKIKINHFDFYRINRIEELFDIGFEEYLTDDAVTIIEWAELFEEILPKNRINIFINFVSEKIREIKIDHN